jgi:hypothetical protein
MAVTGGADPSKTRFAVFWILRLRDYTMSVSSLLSISALLTSSSLKVTSNNYLKLKQTKLWLISTPSLESLPLPLFLTPSSRCSANRRTQL